METLFWIDVTGICCQQEVKYHVRILKSSITEEIYSSEIFFARECWSKFLRPVTYDLNGELVDEDTAVAPHQMPPPLLVDGDGNEYAMDIQRLVPGRDYLNEVGLLEAIHCGHFASLFSNDHFVKDCANEGGVLPSPWLTRDLVQRLPPSTINIYNCRTAALRELEMKDFAREACKKKPLDLVSVEVILRAMFILIATVYVYLLFRNWVFLIIFFKDL